MKRYLAFIILTAVIISVLITPLSAVLAEETAQSINDSYVVDDLTSATIDGQPFDPADFPADPDAQPQILSFQEYGYSYYADEQDLFGLYIYIYNPSAQTIRNSTRNAVSIAVGYDENGIPNDYAKFKLVLCSRSADEYSNLFYKFRIADPSGKIKARVATTPLERRYDVAEIELVFGADNAAAYGVGGTFRFTGYAAGLGPQDDNESSTLSCDVTDLETITLDVHPTVWRSESSSAGAGHHNQLHSVYFAVEDRFFETYGALQKIKAMYYEMQLQPAVVTYSNDIYNHAIEFVGKTVESYNERLFYVFATDFSADSQHGILHGDWSYNIADGRDSIHGKAGDFDRRSELLSLLFLKNSEESTLSVEELINYIKNYNASYESGEIDFLGGISADLFDLEKSKPNEATVIELDVDNADDKHDLLSYNETHDFWDQVGDYGLWNALLGRVPDDESITAVDPIVIVDENDFSLSKADLCEKYMINESDYEEFISYANAHKNGSKIVLFRYRVSDYVSKNLEITTKNNPYYPSVEGYVFDQSIDLEFDIISLTFNKDGNYTVIPVVADPINVIGSGDPPPDYSGNGWLSWLLQKLEEIWAWIVATLGGFAENWWKYLLVALAIIVGVPLAFYLIKTIITLPWKIIAQHERNKRYKKRKR